MTLIDIHKHIKACHDCPLRAGCKAPVPGVYFRPTTDPCVMFVGEGPGAEEDGKEPFIGPSGQMLRSMIEEVPIHNAYLTNMVKCRPPNNRDPHPSEINACNHHLEAEIQAINPKVIVAVGRYAMAQFLPDDLITKARGKPHIVHGRVVLPIIHTAAALRRPEWVPVIAGDLRLIPRLLDTPLESNDSAKLTIL